MTDLQPAITAVITKLIAELAVMDLDIDLSQVLSSVTITFKAPGVFVVTVDPVSSVDHRSLGEAVASLEDGSIIVVTDTEVCTENPQETEACCEDTISTKVTPA